MAWFSHSAQVGCRVGFNPRDAPPLLKAMWGETQGARDAPGRPDPCVRLRTPAGQQAGGGQTRPILPAGTQPAMEGVGEAETPPSPGVSPAGGGGVRTRPL